MGEEQKVLRFSLYKFISYYKKYFTEPINTNCFKSFANKARFLSKYGNIFDNFKPRNKHFIIALFLLYWIWNEEKFEILLRQSHLVLSTTPYV